jgi:hypothetical protein
MDRKRKSFSTSSNSASPPRALKSVIAVAIAVGFIVGALPAAVSTPGAASTAQHVVSVNRTNKGDRLPLTLKRTSNVSSLPWQLSRSRQSDVTRRSAASRTQRAHISLAAVFPEFVRFLVAAKSTICSRFLIEPPE